MPKIELTNRELFALERRLCNSSSVRTHKFGVVGLNAKLYGAMKEHISPKEYKTLKEEWLRTNPDVEDWNDDLPPGE